MAVSCLTFAEAKPSVNLLLLVLLLLFTRERVHSQDPFEYLINNIVRTRVCLCARVCVLCLVSR